jgi:hypothetical protein
VARAEIPIKGAASREYDSFKANRVEELLAERGTFNVEILNEFAVVALRKLRMTLR